MENYEGKCVPVKQPPVVAFHMSLAKQWQHLLKHNTSSQGWKHYRISGELGDPDEECESPFSGLKMHCTHNKGLPCVHCGLGRPMKYFHTLTET